jgi:hypothetical protein
VRKLFEKLTLNIAKTYGLTIFAVQGHYVTRLNVTRLYVTRLNVTFLNVTRLNAT